MFSLAVQPDGKILVGGAFTTLGGQTRNYLGRLDADGTLDNRFNPGASGRSDPYVYSLAVQADGKILVGGRFTTLGGQTRTNIARLNADGALDSGFNPGADNSVSCMAVQADGKILVGGWFTTLGGQTRTNIARLNADGALDNGFNPGASGGSYPRVDSLAVQADGKILVGGKFTNLAGQTRAYIGRLNADGTLDNAFNPGADNSVSCMAVQADGKILVSGGFTNLAGQTRAYIGRLNADGTLDNAFNPGACCYSFVFSLAVQADGKILVGGAFAALGGQWRESITRLNADGTLDSGFNPGASSSVYCLAVQADGKILVGGGFTALGGQTRSYLGRLNNTEPATQSLSYDGSIFTWQRGGASPEVWRTTFELSTNGSDWTFLGEGSRVPGGWQLTTASLPPDSTVRARGFVTGGYQNASGWFVEAYYGKLALVVQPISRTNDAGTTATFRVVAGGSEPTSFQWLKAGELLTDGGNVAGAKTAMLTLTHVLGGDAGGYSVVVSNEYGSVTSTVATLTVNDPVITVQPVSQNRERSESVTFSVTAVGSPTLNYQWWKDGVMLAGATATTLTLANLQGSEAGNYCVEVSSPYGRATSAMALLTVNLASLDTTFNPGASGGYGLYSLAVQPDGKILVGGSFNTLGGQTRTNIARLDRDGTLDSGFNPGATGWDPFVYSLAVQADGKILVGGGFTVLGGQYRDRIGRLNADGTLDSGFNPGVSEGSYRSVHSLAVQADGKILVGDAYGMHRLNADGTSDYRFYAGVDDGVYSLALQPDGKIVVGGVFTELGGDKRNRIGRLNADGTLDSEFNPGADHDVFSLAVQADGKILVGGTFTWLGGQTRNRIGRLNADGMVDLGFNPGANGEVSSLAVQTDGKILVGGSFTTLGGQTRNYLGRLNADGTVDGGFNPGADGRVYSLAVQADGKIVAGGDFTELGGQGREMIARLNNNEPATQSVSYDGSIFTWLRGGASPEVWRTTFEVTTNGNNVTFLGEGSRVPGGWQLGYASLPPESTVRARGFVTGDASEWFVEACYGKVALFVQPMNRTNDASTTATFRVEAGGSEPVRFQWLKGGELLADGGNVAGAKTAMLRLTQVLGGDAGGYNIVVSDNYGSVTSTVATLTVNDPVITVQPVSQNRERGESVTFSVTAVGTPPLNYQWWHNGVMLSGPTASALALTNLQGSEAGSYWVEVSSAYGSATSAVAPLTVNLASVDTAFNPGADGGVYCLAVQADGTILVGGAFTELDGQTRNRIGRLNADGTVDLGFNPGADGGVYCLAVQADGKILVGGAFTNLGGQARNGIGRLNADGTVDLGFNPGAGSSVSCLALQVDGKVLVGGQFTTLGGETHNYLRRLNADGTVDGGFNARANYYVYCLAVQADGKILVGGQFSLLGGQSRNDLGRLNPDGTLDNGFNPGSTDFIRPAVSSLAVQTDGKILVGGSFTTLGGQTRNRICRFNADGMLDSRFNLGASNQVNCLAVQADGEILVGGLFTELGGRIRNYLGRLNNTEPATQSLFYDRKTVTWLRGGASPEVWRTTFEVSANGRDWDFLGEGSRLQSAEGWILTETPLPLRSVIRARGYVTGGGDAVWYVEAYREVPALITAPIRSGSILVGDTLRFAAEGPVGQYLWDFGDGRSSSLKVPGLVGFPTKGAREVVLTFVDAQGQAGLTPDPRLITVVPDPGTAPDLAVTEVNVPESLAVGQPTEITYSVRNAGDAALAGTSWTDAIYLSRDAWLDTTDTLLATAAMSLDLPMGTSYEGALTVTLPATFEEGACYLILSVDDAWQILERRQLNNEYPVATDVLIPQLEAGVGRTTPHPQGDLDHYYRIRVPTGGQGLHLTFDAVQSGMTVCVRHGALPMPGAYDYRLTGGEVFIPAAAAGDWYIHVLGRTVPAPGEYTLAVETVTLRVFSASPVLHAANAPFDLTLAGAGFLAPVAVELVSTGGMAYAAAVVEVDSLSRLTASFPANTLPPGMYDVRVIRNGDVAELAEAIQIVAAGEPRLVTNLIVPGSVGPNTPATLYVEYANTGEVSMPAPLLILGARDPLSPNQPLLSLDQTRVAVGAWSTGMPEGFSHSVQFLACGDNPGMLQPGESRRIPVYYVGVMNLDQSDLRVRFSLGVIAANDQTPLDWAAMKVDMRPAYVRPDAWDVLWANFTAQTGTTWGDYVAMLSRNAVYLDRQGQRVQDITKLLAFAFRQADALSPLPVLAGGTDAAVQAPGLGIIFQRAHAQPISRRFELGPLGRGWTHNWQYRLETRANGAVSVTDMTGTPRIFQPDTRPGRPYLSAPGDQGVLRAVAGGGFTLTEANGLVRAFRADGLLDYVEDTNGNRITCEHMADRLTRLTHSSGQSLTLAYNEAGRVGNVTDYNGRSTEYTYNGEHLVSVRAYDGRATTYAYDTTPGVAAQHALVEIGLPNGVRRTFAYDARGRLAAIARDEDKEPITFSYSAEGRVTATDALGNASHFFLDYAGRIAKTENPLGSIVRFDFDDLGRLASVSDPVGLSSKFAYDARGNLGLAVDALRHASRFTYTPTLNRIASATDANGNFTVYAHDLHGNLRAISYADGSSETWVYDARGNPIAWANRRGRGIVCDYDAAGRVIRKTYTGGDRVDYGYDARGNLVHAADANGTNTFTYSPADYLVRIDYPAGRWLAFTYDAAGRRTSSLDQTGRRLDYHYGAAGRLERMTDETAAELVRYEYDAAARLARKTVGNGVATDYAYDAAGQITNLVNRAPGGAVISRFDYTDDLRGRRTEMGTHYGTWTYEHDDIGQLARAVLVSTAGDIPNQDLRYSYDALGNRIRATVNGVEEEYTANNLNQYTQVGDRTYTYDLDGNLVEEIGPDGTTIYTYNDENRLVGVTRGADTWEYTYDALGNRVAAAADGVVTHYIVDPIGFGNVVSEYDGTGNLAAHYDHGLGVLNRVDAAGTPVYYTFDVLGDVSDLTGVGGVSHNGYAYRPFGETLRHVASVPNPFEFVGGWGVMTEGNGLNYMRARFYEVVMGRFASTDPIGLAGGDFNLYRYVENSPAIDADPSGMLSLSDAACALRAPFLYRQRINEYFNLWSMIVGYGEYWGWLRDAVKSGSASRPSGYQGIAWDHDWNLHNANAFPLNLLNHDVTRAHAQLIREFAAEVWNEVAYFCGWNKDPSDAPENVPPTPANEGDSNIIISHDPNEMTGPAGYGERNYMAAGKSLAYRVDFENIESATSPAHVVTVSDPLSNSFEWTTFALTEIGFGDELIVVPEDNQEYLETIVPYSFGGVDFEVHIEAGIHLGTGEAFANFYAIDPETGLPPPVDSGFLPPEDGTGRGRGHIGYVIRAKSGLPSGTEIRNVATIQFDFGLKIATNQRNPLDPSQGTDPQLEALVTIDADAPTSRVDPLPAMSFPQFSVSWSGTDGTSGVREYNIYVSRGGATYEPWLLATRGTSADFTGESGHTYTFFSVACDNVGHVESKSPMVEATTTVSLPPASPRIAAAGWDGAEFAVRVPTEWSRTYSLEYKNRLEDPQWIHLDEVVGDGTVRSLVDAESHQVMRFYRVRVD